MTLAGCYKSSLRAAEDLGVKTIAFPAISTGVYGFPLERATEIALGETKRFLETSKGLSKVVFVCFGQQACKTYQNVYKRVFKSSGRGRPIGEIN